MQSSALGLLLALPVNAAGTAGLQSGLLQGDAALATGLLQTGLPGAGATLDQKVQLFQSLLRGENIAPNTLPETVPPANLVPPTVTTAAQPSASPTLPVLSQEPVVLPTETSLVSLPSFLPEDIFLPDTIAQALPQPLAQPQITATPAQPAAANVPAPQNFIPQAQTAANPEPVQPALPAAQSNNGYAQPQPAGPVNTPLPSPLPPQAGENTGDLQKPLLAQGKLFQSFDIAEEQTAVLRFAAQVKRTPTPAPSGATGNLSTATTAQGALPQPSAAAQPYAPNTPAGETPSPKAPPQPQATQTPPLAAPSPKPTPNRSFSPAGVPSSPEAVTDGAQDGVDSLFGERKTFSYPPHSPHYPSSPAFGVTTSAPLTNDTAANIQPSGQALLADPSLDPLSQNDQTAELSRHEEKHPPQQPRTSTPEQLHLHIARAAKDGNSRIVLQLEPATLGKIDVQLDIGSEGKLSLTILAENKDTLDLLQRDARALERALQDAGLKADSGNMYFNLKQQQQSFAQYQRQQIHLPALQTPEQLLGELSANDNLLTPVYRSNRALDLIV